MAPKRPPEVPNLFKIAQFYSLSTQTALKVEHPDKCTQVVQYIGWTSVKSSDSYCTSTIDHEPQCHPAFTTGKLQLKWKCALSTGWWQVWANCYKLYTIRIARVSFISWYKNCSSKFIFENNSFYGFFLNFYNVIQFQKFLQQWIPLINLIQIIWKLLGQWRALALYFCHKPVQT